MSAAALHVLLVEDSEDDAEFVLRELKRALPSLRSERVASAPEMERALNEFKPNVVLCDFSMPGFSGVAALELCRKIDPDVPFIFVSGTIGEQVAVDAMKAGANDYVLKGNLARLPPALMRELREADVRRARRVLEAGLRRAQHLARLAHVITGPLGEFETWSETLPQLFAVEPARMPASTRDWLDLVHPEDRETFRETALRAASTHSRAHVAYRARGAGGGWLHVRQVTEPLEAVSGGRHRWFNTLQDVTEEATAQERIRRLNRVHAVLSGINALIVRVRERGELFREACHIAVESGGFCCAWIGTLAPEGAVKIAAAWGTDSAFYDSLDGTLRQLLAPVSPPAVEPVILQGAENRSLAILPLMVSGRAAAVIALEADAAGLFDDEEMRLLRGLAGDISFALEHIEKSERVDYLSYHDPLTGLANRTLFDERLAQALAAARRDRTTVALVLFDIERFRAMNDSLGRQAGDAILKGVADRMSSKVTDATWLARVGANHFSLFVPGLRSAEDIARRTAERLELFFGEPFRVAGTELHVSARCGIAVFPDDAADAETLFRNAEAALNKAKEGPEPYLFFEQRMTARVAENLALENRLRKALEQEQFILHYQPKVELAGRRVVGLEALIRWQTPQEGLVPPVKFIGLLEDTGLILPVGAWALARAAGDRRRWLDAGSDAPRVAVNVSPIQLRQRDFVQTVQNALAGNGADPGVDLEITESTVMEDIDANIGKLKALRDLGISIAIDDFGTGYSSLAYLAKLPVQTLKIDRSFVKAMDSDRNAMTLVATIISLAHSLGLAVVAEGVETEQQAETLSSLGCDQLQGYLFSKPVPPDGVMLLLPRKA